MQNQQKPQISQILNATIVTGEYTDKNTNQKKKRYLAIGTLFVYQDGGMSLKLDAYPTRGQNISFYPQKAKEQYSQNSQTQSTQYTQNSQNYQQNNSQQDQGNYQQNNSQPNQGNYQQ